MSGDHNKPVVPKIPAPRRSPENGTGRVPRQRG
ncbi:hypothetical protein K377_07992 [Streptomyces sp. PsTaAH-137]|nr:hypothetical protein K377_07992 [Streptomyces sp. PsTaAH-137]